MYLTPYRKRGELSFFDPFREMEELERSFFGERGLSSFRTDIQDVGDAYLLTADLPGFRKEDISVDLDRDSVTIRAERHSEFEDKDKKNSFVRCERSFGSFERSFSTGGIDTEKMKATFEDGVLKLNMPKQKESPATSRRLEIN